MSLAQWKKDDEKLSVLNFLKFRPIRPDEDRTVGWFLIHAFAHTYSKKLPHAQLNEARREDLLDVAKRRECGGVWVLELGYQIIGSVCLLLPNTPLAENWIPDAVTLRCLAIDPQFHGLGLSNLLLHEVENITRGWGHPAICLHVQQGANGVASLYTKRGYRRDEKGDQTFLGTQIEGYCLKVDALPLLKLIK